MWCYAVHSNRQGQECPARLEHTGRRHAKVAALRRLANNRLRAEVEIHAKSSTTTSATNPGPRGHPGLPAGPFDKEIGRLLREGKGAIQIVRTSLAVRDRLDARYTPSWPATLHGFWLALSTHGEEDTRADSRPTFYRRRKQLD